MLKHVTVFDKPGCFAGWPANYGIWSWGDEILVGFVVGKLKIKPDGGHAIDDRAERQAYLARSLDGGESWSSEPLRLENGEAFSTPAHTSACPGGVDFTAPGFCAMFHCDKAEGGVSYWLWSGDRGRLWHGPYRIPPMEDMPSVNTRTDYHVLGSGELLLMMTCSKQDGHEGRVFSAKLTGGGARFEFLSYVGEEPAGFLIMPASAFRRDGTLVALCRAAAPAHRHRERYFSGDYYIEQWFSPDSGSTWYYDKRLTEDLEENGNPAALAVGDGGEWVFVTGHRFSPFGMYAYFSADEGRLWRQPVCLRGDGGCWDLGYPRICRRADGKYVAVYYFNKNALSERTIEATVFDSEL